MGNLANLVTSVVSAIKAATDTLQIVVIHRPYVEPGGNGQRTYGTATSYKVVIEHKQRFVTVADFSQQLSKASIQFLNPINIHVEDEITLPDGDKPQILSIDGVLDPGGVFYAPRVFF